MAPRFANYVPGVPIFGDDQSSRLRPGGGSLFRPGRRLCHSAAYEFGNTAPTLDWVRGFTQKAESVSMGKTFPIKERLHAQFRIDVNNPFNFVRWSNPNTSITSADYGQSDRVGGRQEGTAVPHRRVLTLAVARGAASFGAAT